MLSAQQMRSLPDFFTDIADPRRAQGRRHSLPTVLAICAGAILCGMRGYKAIADWAQSLGPKARQRLHCRRVNGRYLVPSESIIRDVMIRVDPTHLDRSLKRWNQAYGQHDTTLAIEQCYEAKTETADAAIDAMRQASFAGASAAQQAVINGDDRGWLTARATVCAKAYQTGGTIDGINVGGCLLDESTARLDALKGITPPEAQLKSTDSTSLSQLSWYTTPGLISRTSTLYPVSLCSGKFLSSPSVRILMSSFHASRMWSVIALMPLGP